MVDRATATTRGSSVEPSAVMSRVRRSGRGRKPRVAGLEGASQSTVAARIQGALQSDSTPPGGGACELLGGGRGRVFGVVSSVGGDDVADRRAGRGLRTPNSRLIPHHAPDQHRSHPRHVSRSACAVFRSRSRLHRTLRRRRADCPAVRGGVARYNQRFALDLVRPENGRIVGEEIGNAAVHSWEQPLRSPVDGKVVVARDDIDDAEGTNFVTDAADAAGNVIVSSSIRACFSSWHTSGTGRSG